MKDFIKGLAVTAAVLILAPLVPAVLAPAVRDNPGETVPAVADIAEPIYKLIENVSVYDGESGEAVNYSCEDYLTAAVFGSVSAAAEPELLKAQAVLMYTYILGRRIDESLAPTYELHGCDIGTDTEKYIRLVSDSEAKALYKEKYGEYNQKVRNAVREVAGEYCAYNYAPIVPAYCFSCGGVTESSLTVLGTDVPYLKSVKSPYDEGFTSEAVFTKDELFARISTQNEGLMLLGDPAGWIETVSAEESGYVKEIALDSKYTVSGQQLAGWLNLPSARFTVSYSEEFSRFTFNISGSGHLVGFSQYGANEMAKNGMTYKELLTHYFKGITIEKSPKQ